MNSEEIKQLINRTLDRATRGVAAFWKERVARTTKTVRETEAEAVAFVACSAVQLETASASEDYIGLYRSDAETLLESLQHVQQAANPILNFLLPSEEERVAATGFEGPINPGELPGIHRAQSPQSA